jgi:hypothetical protein
MKAESQQGGATPGYEVVSDVVKVSQAAGKASGLASGLGKVAGTGAMRHAGIAVGGGAGGGFMAGKATGLKLGLGLGGFGGPILLAALFGAGGYILYKAVRNDGPAEKSADSTG